MHRLLRWLVVLVAVVGCVGCPGRSPDTAIDGGVRDAGDNGDAGSDAGVLPAATGEACTSNCACAAAHGDGVCLSDADGYPSGSCSEPCTSDRGCPAGALCADFLCMPRCARDADCRAGYGCDRQSEGRGRCIPRATCGDGIRETPEECEGDVFAAGWTEKDLAPDAGPTDAGPACTHCSATRARMQLEPPAPHSTCASGLPVADACVGAPVVIDAPPGRLTSTTAQEVLPAGCPARAQRPVRVNVTGLGDVTYARVELQSDANVYAESGLGICNQRNAFPLLVGCVRAADPGLPAQGIFVVTDGALAFDVMTDPRGEPGAFTLDVAPVDVPVVSWGSAPMDDPLEMQLDALHDAQSGYVHLVNSAGKVVRYRRTASRGVDDFNSHPSPASAGEGRFILAMWPDVLWIARAGADLVVLTDERSLGQFSAVEPFCGDGLFDARTAEQCDDGPMRLTRALPDGIGCTEDCTLPMCATLPELPLTATTIDAPSPWDRAPMRDRCHRVGDRGAAPFRVRAPPGHVLRSWGDAHTSVQLLGDCNGGPSFGCDDSTIFLGVSTLGLVDPTGIATVLVKAYDAPPLFELVAPACGDGVLEDGELCDDGNRLAGDGCTPDCDLEANALDVEPNNDIAASAPFYTGPIRARAVFESDCVRVALLAGETLRATVGPRVWHACDAMTLARARGYWSSTDLDTPTGACGVHTRTAPSDEVAELCVYNSSDFPLDYTLSVEVLPAPPE